MNARLRTSQEPHHSVTNIFLYKSRWRLVKLVDKKTFTDNILRVSRDVILKKGGISKGVKGDFKGRVKER